MNAPPAYCEGENKQIINLRYLWCNILLDWSAWLYIKSSFVLFCGTQWLVNCRREALQPFLSSEQLGL